MKAHYPMSIIQIAIRLRGRGLEHHAAEHMVLTYVPASKAGTICPLHEKLKPPPWRSSRESVPPEGLPQFSV